MLPENMTRFYRIEKLNLANNEFKKIPPVIFKLKSLQQLDIGKNQLREVPEEICLLNKLWNLNLSENFLTYLPIKMEKIVGKLEFLDISGNNFRLRPEILKKFRGRSLKEDKNPYINNKQ